MDSLQTYTEKYKKGYGTLYPESHIIRFYEHFLKYEKKIKKGGKRILDFGCGNGNHMAYFAEKNFNVFGVDIISQAIEIAKQKLPIFKDNFISIKPNSSITNLFDKNFDIIMANQSLYYLSNGNLKNTLDQMNTMLVPQGIVYFTMMGIKNYYYQHSKIMNDMDGLRKVTLTGRINETTYINFIENENQLLKIFDMFKPYFIGYYDTSLREGSTFHYQFIGIKR